MLTWIWQQRYDTIQTVQTPNPISWKYCNIPQKATNIKAVYSADCHVMYYRYSYSNSYSFWEHFTAYEFKLLLVKEKRFWCDLCDKLPRIMDTPIPLDPELCLLGNVTNLKLSQSSRKFIVIALAVSTKCTALTWRSDSPPLYIKIDIRNN